jgi:hypothetical protein
MRSAEDRAILRAAKDVQARERRERKAARPKVDPVRANRGRERDGAYLQWLRRQPCVIGALGGPGTSCSGPTQAAHLRYGDASVGRVNPGLQVKPSDAWATGLCASHHAEQHANGNEARWWNAYGLDGTAVAQAQYRAFQEDGR